jgi:N-acyl-L-homoserine lactone synthetase
VCDLRITTGEQFERWFNYMDQICEWARKEGCKKMEIFARPGWERILKHKGFRKTHVQIEREL